MSESLPWVLVTLGIAALFGFAAVVLWLLERMSTVPPLRSRHDEGRPGATDAAIIVGGMLVLASALIEPDAPYVIPLGMALVAMGAIPFQRSAARRQGMRVLALLLFLAVHGLYQWTRLQ